MLRSTVRSLALRHALNDSFSSCRVAPSGAFQAQRSFAAAADADAQPPLALFGVAGKYASALYVSAAKNKALDPVGAELQQLANLSTSSPQFSNFLRDPSVPKGVRVEAIQKIFGEAEFTPITKNFLAVLAENGRLSQLPKVAGAYEELLMAHRGEVKAKVTAAMELTPTESSEITDALKAYLKPGQVLKLEQTVNRSIVGGLVIEIGDKYIDLSINSRIKQMEQLLAQNL
eukprot:jgi/Mesen1/4842/ME000244S04020